MPVEIEVMGHASKLSTINPAVRGDRRWPYRAGDKLKFKETVYDAAGRVKEQREPVEGRDDPGDNHEVLLQRSNATRRSFT